MAKARKSRDVLCMFFFVLCWVVWLALVWTTITDGCPDKYVSACVPLLSPLLVVLHVCLPAVILPRRCTAGCKTGVLSVLYSERQRALSARVGGKGAGC